MSAQQGVSNAWRSIDELPASDDLFWFRRGDVVDGPRPPAAGGDDSDYWDHFAACEAPPLAELIERSEREGDDALATALERVRELESSAYVASVECGLVTVSKTLEWAIPHAEKAEQLLERALSRSAQKGVATPAAPSGNVVAAEGRVTGLLREPTPEMCEAGMRSLRCDLELGRRPQQSTARRAARNAWVTMFDIAASAQPKQEAHPVLFVHPRNLELDGAQVIDCTVRRGDDEQLPLYLHPPAADERDSLLRAMVDDLRARGHHQCANELHAALAGKEGR